MTLCRNFFDYIRKKTSAGKKTNTSSIQLFNFDGDTINHKNILLNSEASGEISFPGSRLKVANYIKLEHDTQASDAVQYLYNEWKMQKPKLIISVTGGAKRFKIPHKTRKAFKCGLVKAAISTGGWIITGGTNTGVMRLVGEAVAEEYEKYDFKLPVLGIATWGVVLMRDKLLNKEKKLIHSSSNTTIYADDSIQSSNIEDVLLEPNHTHFLLVDDKTENSFGVEIDFRVKFEAELRRGLSLENYKSGSVLNERSKIPMVLIVVQGGPNSLLLVEKSIKENIPILVLAKSKGVADLICQALLIVNPSDEQLKKLLEEFIFHEKNGASNQEQLYLQRLKYIILEKNSNLINVFRLNDEDNGHDIELAILRAFLNVQKSKSSMSNVNLVGLQPTNDDIEAKSIEDNLKHQFYENLKLAIKWNRIDLAKSDIFTGEEDFRPSELIDLMEMALIQNKPEFVELLLENGVSLRKEFLTAARLFNLYNSKIIRTLEKKAPLFQLFDKRDSRLHPITFSDIKVALKEKFFDSSEPCFLPKTNFYQGSNDNNQTSVECPLENLFVWALLLNRIEMAKLFWRIGQHQIISALFASNLLNELSKEMFHSSKELKESSIYFEQVACEVLYKFDLESNDEENRKLLSQNIPFYNNLSILKMAAETENLEFISMDPVQKYITKKWNGDFANNSSFLFQINIFFFLSFITFGLLAPFLLFEDHKKNIGPKKNFSLKFNSFVRRYMKRFKSFIECPKVHFTYEFTFYIAFLALFSYVMLCEYPSNRQPSFDIFNPKTLDESLQILKLMSENLNKGTIKEIYLKYIKTNETNQTVNPESHNTFSILEQLLFVWVISFALDEIVQFYFVEFDTNFKCKWKKYFKHSWNYLDLTSCSTFFIGVIFRVLNNEKSLDASRIIFAISLSSFYLRILHASMIFKALGPKLVMIKKMFYDLLFFVTIITIFIILFGVVTQATMFPKQTFDLNLLETMFTRAYWPIMGDMSMLLKIFSGEQNSPLPEESGVRFTKIATVIYMLIANILLINLLIATFSSTYAEVQVNADQIWRFQRYRFVFVYAESSIFPPPIGFVGYIIKLIIFSIKRPQVPIKEELIHEKKLYENCLKFGKTGSLLFKTNAVKRVE